MTFNEYPLHDSQRGWFARALYFEMQAHSNTILLTGDLGYGMFDKIRDDFPDQFINCGAAEQCMLGAAAGLAISGKTVFAYSITSFLLYRGFEWIRNYLNHEKIPVLLIGSGLDDDYEHDGITHQTFDAKDVMCLFPNIDTYYPNDKTIIPHLTRDMIERKLPAFMALRR